MLDTKSLWTCSIDFLNLVGIQCIKHKISGVSNKYKDINGSHLQVQLKIVCSVI